MFSFFVSILLIIMGKWTKGRWEIFAWCHLCLSSVDWRKRIYSPLAFIYLWSSDLFLVLVCLLLNNILFNMIRRARRSDKTNADHLSAVQQSENSQLFWACIRVMAVITAHKFRPQMLFQCVCQIHHQRTINSWVHIHISLVSLSQDTPW